VRLVNTNIFKIAIFLSKSGQWPLLLPIAFFDYSFGADVAEAHLVSDTKKQPVAASLPGNRCG